MTGMRTEADIQDASDRQHREQDPLQEAQQTGQFAEQNLTREGSDEDQRDAVETKCIEGEYRFGVKKTRQSKNLELRF